MNIEDVFKEIILKYSEELKGIKGVWLLNEGGEIIETYAGLSRLSPSRFLSIVDKLSNIYKDEIEEVVFSFEAYSIYYKKLNSYHLVATFLEQANLGLLRLLSEDMETTIKNRGGDEESPNS